MTAIKTTGTGNAEVLDDEVTDDEVTGDETTEGAARENPATDDSTADDLATDGPEESCESNATVHGDTGEKAENAARKQLFTRDRRRRGARRSISVRALVASLLVIAALAMIAVLGWKVHSQSDELTAQRTDADGRQHAEQVALDYSVGAAQMDYRDENAWTGRLTKGTSPDLSNRLRQAADSMQQLTVPMQWTSIAQPITAKVLSDNNGVYQVVCFVNVLTKNVQATDGIQSTATYRMTINSNDNWQITEISGIGPAQGTTPAGG